MGTGQWTRVAGSLAIMLSCVAQQDLHGIAAFFGFLFFSPGFFFFYWKAPCCDLAPAHAQISADHVYTERNVSSLIANENDSWFDLVLSKSK